MFAVAYLRRLLFRAGCVLDHKSKAQIGRPYIVALSNRCNKYHPLQR